MMGANVIIKADVRLEAADRVLREYGCDPKTASAQEREYAETISRRMEQVNETIRKGE